MFYDSRIAPGPTPQAALDLVKITFPNAATAEVSFSGGNDEGGPDNILVLDADGRQIGTLSEYEGRPWDVFELDATGAPVMEKVKTDFYPHEHETQKVATKKAGPRYARAAEELTYPIDYCYGSFAGSPYISGTLSWDLSTGICQMEDQPSR